MNLETPQLITAIGEPRQQEGSNLSFTAIDMVAKLVVLLVKVCASQNSDFIALVLVYCVLVLFWYLLLNYGFLIYLFLLDFKCSTIVHMHIPKMHY